MAAPNKRLRRERQLCGWSQAYLAEQLSVPDYYISRWERGEVLPSPYYQHKLCDLFGKTAEALGFLQPENEPLLPQTHRIDEGVSFPSAQAQAYRGLRSNPFTYGNPISDPQRFFGRRHEVEQVFSRLRNAEFESSSLVGERRIGKTSLLKYLAHPLVRQHYGFDPDHYLFVYVDLQMVDEQTTPGRLWPWLLRQLASACSDPHLQPRLKELQQTQALDTFALEELFDHLDAQGQYVVLLLDEFEQVTENRNFPAAFFYGLRSLAIHHHLALITSSRRELLDLCHSQAIRSSPFFNIFATIQLGLFMHNEVLDLISHLLGGTGICFTETELEILLRLAGSHPYLLQVACSFLFDAYSRNLNPDERMISLREAFRQEAGPHLAFYWHSSDEQEKIVLIALTLLAGQCRSNASPFSRSQLQELSAHASPTLARLEKRSLVVSTGEAFTLFNESFGEWIWNELTDARHNQQSYQEWLMSQQQVTDRLKGWSETTKKELSELLSQMNGQYHALMLSWLTEPRMVSMVSRLIKQVLEAGWGFPA